MKTSIFFSTNETSSGELFRLYTKFESWHRCAFHFTELKKVHGRLPTLEVKSDTPEALVYPFSR